MSIQTELRDMALALASTEQIPDIEEIAFPPLFDERQPADCEFMALALEGGAVGLSYVAIPEEAGDPYRALQPSDFVATHPGELVADFGCGDPVRDMIAMAALNAICQHVMRLRGLALEDSADSLGLMRLRDGDKVGMVGLFGPLVRRLREVDAEVIILEKNETLIRRHPELPITFDVRKLRGCNKVLCTGTTVLNGSLDEVLTHCTEAEHVAVLGPTAGYFPDPLFARNVHVLGGRFVCDGPLLMKRIAERKPWREATRKLCFEKSNYQSVLFPRSSQTD
ncbi:MAG: hypothetical protein GY725_05295 [bacterium]|nr:hypothetical protein [bacterium]